MNSAGAAFSVRFLRNGDTITLEQLVKNGQGTGAALFQVIDPTSKAVVPDWSKAENDAIRPYISLGLLSAAGMPTEIKAVTWAYDGKTIGFGTIGSEWTNSTTEEFKNTFQARILNGRHELKIINNLASETVVSNRQIDFAVEYVSGALKDTIYGSADVHIQQAGSNSHMLQITTSNVTLDSATTQTTLNIEAYYGTQSVTPGSGGYTVQWFKDPIGDSAEVIGTGASLVVTRDMVEGGNIFVCKLLLNGNIVAQDQQRINDIADEYQIRATAVSAASSICTPTNNAVFKLGLYRNGDTAVETVERNWTWTVYDAAGNPKVDSGKTYTGKGSTVTITPDHCLIKGSNEYSGVDVAVTVEF